LYSRTFPEHLVFINRIFDDYTPEDIVNLENSLRRLYQTVTTLRSSGNETPADETDE